jgi:peroxiredoxin
MSLTEKLAAMRAGAKERLAPETFQTMRSAIQSLKDSGIEDRGLKPGSPAPAFALPNARGETVSSGDMLKDGAIVISFYRGGWCPYCNAELRALQEKLPEITDLGASLVAVSPETPDHSLSTAEKNELTFEVLSDRGNRLARDFGLVFTLPDALRPIYEKLGIDLAATNGDETFELPVPATFVIDGKGVVRHAFVDADYTQRLDPVEVVNALRKVAADN